MADCTHGARYSLRGAAGKVTNLRSLRRFGKSALSLSQSITNERDGCVRCFHSLLASRLSVTLNIPRNPRRSRMATWRRGFLYLLVSNPHCQRSCSDDGASSSVPLLCRGQRIQADDCPRGRGICLRQVRPLGNTGQSRTSSVIAPGASSSGRLASVAAAEVYAPAPPLASVKR